MKLYLLVIWITIFGCSTSKKFVERNQQGKFIYYSGNLSGLDYIIVDKKVRGGKEYTLTIDCNHYITGVGKIVFLKKTLYSQSGSDYTTFYFIKDTSMVFKLNLNQDVGNNFVKLSEEEYKLIKTSFQKYPVLATKYSLNADSFKNYLGWLK